MMIYRLNYFSILFVILYIVCDVRPLISLYIKVGSGYIIS